jgi:hypothetical protein
MSPIQRIRSWTMRLPEVGGMGQALKKIHSSLVVMMGLLSLLVVAVSLTKPGFEELLPAALTLPIVWLVSLTVRVAAQQLVLGEHALDMEMIVGPTGNLSIDYEYLPAKRIFFYSAAGQLATVGLALLGFVINAALTQVATSELSVAELLDLKGGWRSDAWASQIMWINLFLAALHALPTVPFDMRATIFGLFSMRNRRPQEPQVFRKMAGFDSHLASFMLGAGLTTMLLGWVFQTEIVGWYAAVAAAVYLFVAGQWEASRAEDLEEQYAPIFERRHPQAADESKRPHLMFTKIEPDAADQDTGRDLEPRGPEAVPDFLENDAFETTDVDEILRKLHREGRSALSLVEQQALLSASRQLNERRGQARNAK